MSTVKPLIGCTTYHQPFPGEPSLSVYALTTSYVHAIEKAGGLPVLIPLGLPEADLIAIFERLDGVLLPGGGDVDPQAYGGMQHEKLGGVNPERDRTEFWVARCAAAEKKPLLAICRGHQVLNVALGGSLFEDVAELKVDAMRHDYFRTYPRNFMAHTVEIEPDSRLAAALGRTMTEVNSLHHQGIREVGAGLRVTAVAPDGLVEGLEIPDHPFAVSVQWHPENLVEDDEAMVALFRAFVQAASGVVVANGRS